MRIALTIVVATGLLCGCDDGVRPAPPRPPEYSLQELAPASREAEAPRVITILWDASPDPVAFYRVYFAPAPLLSEMRPLGETMETYWEDVADQPQRFYQVKAVGATGLESDWATKKTP